MPSIPFRPIPRPIPRPFAEPPPSNRGQWNVRNRIPDANSSIQPYNPPGKPNNFPSPGPDTPIPGWNLNPRAGNGTPGRPQTIPVEPIKPPQQPKRPPIPWTKIVKDAVKETWENFSGTNQSQDLGYLFNPNAKAIEEVISRIDDEIQQQNDEWVQEESRRQVRKAFNDNGLPKPGTFLSDCLLILHWDSYRVTIVPETSSSRSTYEENLGTYEIYAKAGDQLIYEVYYNAIDTTYSYDQVFIETTLFLLKPNGQKIKIFLIYSHFVKRFDLYPTPESRTVENKIHFTSPDLKVDPRPYISYRIIVRDRQDEDEMKCQTCEAARVIRSLRQTITVDTTTLTPIPTGDLLVTTGTKTQQVFCLPGTQQSIKEQFNLFAEIKKRTAHAFNQARRAKILAKLQQLMSVTDFVLNVHNALMLSEDIVQTFFQPIFGAVDTLIKVVDDTPFIGELFDLGETPVNSGEFFAKALEDKLKQIFGAENWEAIKTKWAAANNIVRNAAMQIQAARDIADAQRDLSEMTASRVGKLHNKLAKAGLLGDSDLWEEKVNRRWAWMYKLEDMAEDNRFTNTAQFIQSWGGQLIDIREQQKEMTESRDKFKTDLKSDFDKIMGEKAKTVEASAGANYVRSDANPPAEDDAQ